MPTRSDAGVFTGPLNWPSYPTTTSFAGLFPGTQDVPGSTDYTGPVIAPENNLYPGSTTYSGQGLRPMLWPLWSFTSVSTPPVWVNLTQMRVRDFSSSRGRDSETSEFDAGTATVTLDNRDRAFDPAYTSGPYYPNVRPMNQLWLREQFNGLTNDVFKGYVESYDQQQPPPGQSDAITVVSAVDEFKPLALARLPVTNPPRDSYDQVVGWDRPVGYWRMHDDPAAQSVTATIGPQLTWLQSGSSSITSGLYAPINGNNEQGSLALVNGGQFFFLVESSNEGDTTNLPNFTIEMWFGSGGWPAVDRVVAAGPDIAGSADTAWKLKLLTTGAFQLTAYNSGLTLSTATSAVLPPGPAYHVVGAIESGQLRLYINGVQVAAASFTGVLPPPEYPTAFQVGDAVGTVGPNWVFSEVAFYRIGMTAARVAAHYSAGVSRGFGLEAAHTRIGNALDSVTSHAPRYLRSATRAVVPAYMHGQDPLGECRYARSAENVDAMLFVGKDGTVTFLDAAHRTAAPWNTIQATFGEDTAVGQLPFLDLDTDYSDAFLTNEFNVTRTGGLVQTLGDPASQALYGIRSQSLEVPVPDDANAVTIANDLIFKYKNPFTRAMSLSLTTDDVNVCDKVFQLEIGDRIRIVRTLPRGLGFFDQILYIQKIDVSGANDVGPWIVRMHVSPV